MHHDVYIGPRKITVLLCTMENRALQEGRAPRAPNACAWVADTASKKRHGLLQAACTSMVKECSQNGVGCHDSYPGVLHRNKGKNPRAQSSKTHKASTLTRMAQQHHHDSLSQHTSQYSDSYHVYHLRYRLIRMAQMLLACALLHVTQLNMQREVLFQRTRCLSGNR